MISLLTKTNRPYDREEILNVGLRIAMEWGENWLMPIQERLGKKYPCLTDDELDGYNKECQEAMNIGHSSVEYLADEYGLDVPYEEFEKLVQGKLPWITEKNLSKAYSQGMYYVRK